MTGLDGYRCDVSIRDLWDTLKRKRIAPNSEALCEFLVEQEATIRSCEHPVLDLACYSLAYEDGVRTAVWDFDERAVRLIAANKMAVALSFYGWQCGAGLGYLNLVGGVWSC